MLKKHVIKNIYTPNLILYEFLQNIILSSRMFNRLSVVSILKKKSGIKIKFSNLPIY